METKPIFSCASITAIMDGKQVDLGKFMVNAHRVVDEHPIFKEYVDDPVVLPTLAGFDVTLHGRFKPSAGYYILVGHLMPYPLRDLHRNLGRYTRWPYTN